MAGFMRTAANLAVLAIPPLFYFFAALLSLNRGLPFRSLLLKSTADFTQLLEPDLMTRRPALIHPKNPGYPAREECSSPASREFVFIDRWMAPFFFSRLSRRFLLQNASYYYQCVPILHASRLRTTEGRMIRVSEALIFHHFILPFRTPRMINVEYVRFGVSRPLHR